MVNVFAREITDDLASLVKQIDEVVAQNQDKQMRGYVTILTDDPEAAESKLQKLAEEHGIEHVPLTVFDGTAGPPNYKIAEDADVTVLMWQKAEVKVNHAFKGKLGDDEIQKIVSDTEKIL